MSAVKATKRPKYRFLESDSDYLFAEPADIENGAFRLLPPRFEPLANQPNLADGTPPTAVGLALMEWWAACTGRPAPECPTGLVRAVEAVSATGDNDAEIRRAFRGSAPRWRRNHAGRIAVAEIEVSMPLVGVATVQPRENAHTSRILRERDGLPLIYEVEEGLVLRGRSARHFLLLRQAQKEAIDPGNYALADRKDFIDSLALEGIRESLRGFVYRLRATDEDQSGYHVETDDGYTRVSVSQATMKVLLGGLATDFSRLHWENGDGTTTIRDWSPDSITKAHQALRFADAPFEVWPSVETTAGIRKWATTACPQALATMRMMTARMEIGILAEPRAGSTTHMVAFADMARYHVKGHQPVAWNATDNEGFKARTIITSLAKRNYVNPDEKAIFFGNEQLPWKDDPGRTPYRNRLLATMDVMVKCVVDSPAVGGRYHEVRAALKQMRVPNSPTQAAASAASLAVVIAGLERDAEMGGCAAMLKTSFANASVRQIKDQPGDWTEVVADDVGVIVQGARDELESVLGTAKHGTYLGPNMRALALLAMVAHGINPALVGYQREDGHHEDGTVRMVRLPSSMTRTGRGGRGGPDISKADAYAIVYNAVKSPKGIGQLEVVVRAVTDHDEPVIPLDPVTGEELLEEHLRRIWKRAPDMDGRPQGGDGVQEDGDEEGERIDPTSTGGWDRQIAAFADQLRGMKALADSLAGIPVGPDATGKEERDPNDNDQSTGNDEEKWDPNDDDLPRMIDFEGINPELAEDYNENLDVIRGFFLRGVMTYYKRRTRP